jgi:25S rRNA (uracil2634-N3)-methyltransferase
VRPESCPRSRTQQQNEGTPESHDDLTAFGYHPGMSILMVGDGDFTFSLALARSLLRRKEGCEANNIKPMGQASTANVATTTIIASSYESYEQLQSIYPPESLQKTIDELKALGTEVLFEVDATNLRGTLPKLYTNPTDTTHQHTLFHRIVWNFPCSAIGGGQDGQNAQMEFNKYLVRKFMVQASTLLHPIMGEAHMTHKTKPPYDQWKLDQVAVEPWEVPGQQESKYDQNDKVNSKGLDNSMEYAGRIVFDKCSFWPYTPRKAKDKKSFPCHDACIFVFGRKDSVIFDKKGRARKVQSNRRKALSEHFPSTIPVDASDQESQDYLNRRPIAVTSKIIDKVRNTHLVCAQHRHSKGNKRGSDERTRDHKRGRY